MSAELSTAAGVDHIVLLRVKEDVSKETIAKMEEGVKSLAEIPGVLSVMVGETFVEEWMDDRRDGYSHYIRVRLGTKDDLKLYQDHELHINVKKEFIAPIVSGPPLAVDCASPMVLTKAAGSPPACCQS